MQEVFIKSLKNVHALNPVTALLGINLMKIIRDKYQESIYKNVISITSYNSL